ncbi:unnamed protein product [Ilex paraguariensis]|uniref:BED-type domain-containing protein n=1 Tax=Ilex paraguariensis TaxID=185542 RepID=A0ABC8ULM2_9AQUA
MSVDQLKFAAPPPLPQKATTSLYFPAMELVPKSSPSPSTPSNSLDLSKPPPSFPLSSRFLSLILSVQTPVNLSWRPADQTRTLGISMLICNRIRKMEDTSCTQPTVDVNIELENTLNAAPDTESGDNKNDEKRQCTSTSEVWGYFRKYVNQDNVTKAQCNKCKIEYNAASKYGTGNL